MTGQRTKLVLAGMWTLATLALSGACQELNAPLYFKGPDLVAQGGEDPPVKSGLSLRFRELLLHVALVLLRFAQLGFADGIADTDVHGFAESPRGRFIMRMDCNSKCTSASRAPACRKSGSATAIRAGRTGSSAARGG